MAVSLSTLFSDDKMTYDGRQLKPLYNYLEQGLEGDSLFAWIGPCQVETEHLIDGEDRRNSDRIASDQMLHLILELFHWPLHGAVCFQRLIGARCIKILGELKPDLKLSEIEQKGDDIYIAGGKLNVSIASCSANSSLIHFALNIKKTGAPVPISCLDDLGIDAKDFARRLIDQLSNEFTSIEKATRKVITF